MSFGLVLQALTLKPLPSILSVQESQVIQEKIWRVVRV